MATSAPKVKWVPKVKAVETEPLICILDFEFANGQEIAEIGSIICTFENGAYVVKDSFQAFCVLSDGKVRAKIAGRKVTCENAVLFPQAFRAHYAWLCAHSPRGNATDIMLMTFGGSDLKCALPFTCSLYDVPIPATYGRFVDIWDEHRTFINYRRNSNLGAALARYSIARHGVPHQALNDSHDVKNLLNAMVKKGYRITGAQISTVTVSNVNRARKLKKAEQSA